MAENKSSQGAGEMTPEGHREYIARMLAAKGCGHLMRDVISMVAACVEDAAADTERALIALVHGVLDGLIEETADDCTATGVAYATALIDARLRFVEALAPRVPDTVGELLGEA